MNRLVRRLPRPVALGACTIVALLVFAAFQGIRQNRDLSRQNRHLAADLAAGRAQVEALNARVAQLELLLRQAGVEVPARIVLVVPAPTTTTPASAAPRPSQPPISSTTATTVPRATTTTMTSPTSSSTTSTTAPRPTTTTTVCRVPVTTPRTTVCVP